MPGPLSSTTREQIRAASDIVDVVGSYLPLKRAGANFVALCPFHREKSPSFNVNPQKQIFHCFGCHKGGDVFTFVQEYEGISFGEALRRLAERARIPIEFESDPAQKQNRHIKEILLQLHESIAQRWHAALLTDAAGRSARDYLESRGISEEAVKEFRLGYAPDSWDDTVNWAKHKGHDIDLVQQAGLVLRHENTERYYDRFRGRLMFPICDDQGRVIGFSGRVLAGDEKTAKYVNSPETPIFKKGRVIYGLDKAKRAILDAGSAVVCEGQLDLIACHTAGIRNVVAPQGTALTADHARILKRFAEEVVLCFDSDAAGRNAAIRSLDDLLASGLAIRVATIPAPHDPDSLIRDQGADALRRILDGARGFFDFYLDHLCEQNDPDTDRGRSAIVRSMGEAVLKANNAVLADACAQKTAHRLGVSSEAVRTEFSKTHTVPSSGAQAEVEETKPSPISAVPVSERVLLKILIDDEHFVPWAEQYLDCDWITCQEVRSILEKRLELQRRGTWASLAVFLEMLDEGLRSFTTAIVSEPLVYNRDGTNLRTDRPLPKPEIQLAKIVTALRSNSLQRRLEQIKRILSDTTVAQDTVVRLTSEKMALHKARESLPPIPPAPTA